MTIQPASTPGEARAGDLTAQSLESGQGRGRSRRALLRSAVLGATAAVAGAAALQAPIARADSAPGPSFRQQAFDILSTGEKLNVVFYSMGVANRAQLGWTDAELTSLQAILAEEQLHNQYAELSGGVAVTTHFSFPLGATTFSDRASYLTTMQGIEDVTNGALLALIRISRTWACPAKPSSRASSCRSRAAIAPWPGSSVAPIRWRIGHSGR